MICNGKEKFRICTCCTSLYWYQLSLLCLQKDVFLISSNAMKYNAPDTIYFRQVYNICQFLNLYIFFFAQLIYFFVLCYEFAQARAIEELAKRSFDNLRQGGDGTEQQLPKPAGRRGRPPNKNKKPAVKPSSQDAAPDMMFSAPKPTNNSVDENSLRSLRYDITKLASIPEKPAIIDNFYWINEQRIEIDADLSSRCGFAFFISLCWTFCYIPKKP